MSQRRFVLGCVLGLASCAGAAETASPAADSGGWSDGTADAGDGGAAPPTLTISPRDPTTLDDLLATPAGEVPPGATFEWRADNGAVGGVTQTLRASQTAKGQTWTVGLLDGDTALAEDSTTILNAPPSCAVATLGPVGATVEDALLCGCAAFSDPDDDPAAEATCSFADSEDGAPLQGDGPCAMTAGAVAADTSVVCTYTPSDGEESGAPARSNPIRVEPAE